MIDTVFHQTQLYTFLLYCNGYVERKGLNKVVLDCGAGGKTPPLALFAQHGYETHGVEIDEAQISHALAFEAKHGLQLGIYHKDMRRLPFDQNTMSFVYSYNSIFHMRKSQIKEAIAEIDRVMPVGGLTFINFASCHDMRSTEGKHVGDGEFLQMEHGKEVLHSFFRDNEPEEFFQGFRVIYKEQRIREGLNPKEERIKLGFLDYILEKS